MKMAYVLGAAVAAAAGFGFVDHERRQTALSAEHVAEPPAAAMAAGEAPPSDGDAISGKVLETIDVAKYTYLRLATNQGETWVAVSKAPLSVGQDVTVIHAAKMEHFASTTLKRTFDVIYFGALAGAPGASGALPPGHPAIGTSGEQPINGHVEVGKDPGIPEALLANPGGPSQAEGDPAMAPPHPDTPSSSPITVPKLAKAKGPNGYVVADLFANKGLVGKKVRVRGMVTKETVGVMGGNFLHVRDGSGDDAAKTNDLAVTTKAQPAQGTVVIFEGTLRYDADLGIGYRYPALLENATVVTE